MNTKEIPNKFYITYYANKHSKFITRLGQWYKPNTNTVGKAFTSNKGVNCFVYWDLDADGWRMATNNIKLRAVA